MSQHYEFVFGFRKFVIRKEMVEALERYVQDRIPVGDFLRAVLENNLTEAIGRADDGNLQNIQAYAAWLHNEAPSDCWGSKEKVAKWLKARIPEEVI